MSLQQLFTDIANAIRDRDGTTAPIMASEFAKRIRKLSPPPPPKIYGVEWAGTSTTAWTRTDDAVGFTDPVPAVASGTGSSPFDDIMPWAGMVRVTDAAVGELVTIPKFYYKWTKNGNALKLQIANWEAEGFFTSPAHADRGDGTGEREVVYIGRYHCDADYKSTTGVKPKVSISRADARSGIHGLGANVWQSDYAMRVTIWMLYLVEYANWDSQAKIGTGGLVLSDRNGDTDTMPYHTGATSTAYGATQYRYIEGLWDNVYDWMDGCYYNSNGMYVINTPSEFSDVATGSDIAGGVLIGKPSTGIPSAISVCAISGFEWALYPTASNGSNSTYTTDYWGYDNTKTGLICGGMTNVNKQNGLFQVSHYSLNGSSYLGCRLMKLP